MTIGYFDAEKYGKKSNEIIWAKLGSNRNYWSIELH